jgi:hypothetical protein
MGKVWGKVGRKRKKNFLFLTLEIGTKNQNGCSISVVLYSPGIGESRSPEI